MRLKVTMANLFIGGKSLQINRFGTKKPNTVKWCPAPDVSKKSK
jgi:hypothetical protein